MEDVLFGAGSLGSLLHSFHSILLDLWEEQEE